MNGWRVQSVDLTGRTAELLELSPGGVAVPRLRPGGEGGRLDPRRRRAGLPGDPVTALRPYRGTLYNADDLYAGLEHGYEATPDAQIYAWSRQHDEKGDTSRTLAAALHDHSIADALARAPRRQAVDRRDGRTRDRPQQPDVPVGCPARVAPSPAPASPSSPAAARARWRRRTSAPASPRTTMPRSTLPSTLWRAVPSFKPSVAAWAADGPRRTPRVPGRRWCVHPHLVLRPRAAERVRLRDREVLLQRPAGRRPAQPGPRRHHLPPRRRRHSPGGLPGRHPELLRRPGHPDPDDPRRCRPLDGRSYRSGPS